MRIRPMSTGEREHTYPPPLGFLESFLSRSLPIAANDCWRVPAAPRRRPYFRLFVP